MPNRVIKESICYSETLSELSWFEQVLFIRLIVLADDYGLCDARPKILKARAFPIDDVDIDSIQTCLEKIAKTGAIVLYKVEGKQYLQLKSWQKFQDIRAKKPKYPMPSEADEVFDHLQTFASRC